MVNYTEEEYGREYKEHILEQYKLYLEMADKISQRRMDTNNFFISANTLLLAVFSLFSGWEKNVATLVSFVGLIISFSWFFLINSYRQLNSGKFLVVHDIEKLLPLSLYEEEWIKLGRGEDKRKYWPVSHIELSLPIVFMVIYVVIFIGFVIIGIE